MDETQIERLQFHVKTGDYFRVLGTVLGFLEETVENNCRAIPDELMAMEKKTVAQVRKELEHLYQHYRITPKAD